MVKGISFSSKGKQQQMLEFFRELYGEDFVDEESGYVAERKVKLRMEPDSKWIKIELEVMSELIKTIKDLDDEQIYALVARES